MVVTVADERKVLYKDELTSLSAIVGSIKKIKSIQGTQWFTYKGKLLTDIAKEKQWDEA